MHIGIDGACWNNRRGYGRFLRELLTAVAGVDKQNSYTVFLDSASFREFNLGHPFRPVLVETSAAVSDSASSDGHRPVFDLLRMSRAVWREAPDVFLFPTVYSYFPLPPGIPMLLGVHDTIADKNPRFSFNSRRHELFWNAKVRVALAQARTIITVSEYSKDCIESHFNVPGSRIRVLYEAASSQFRRLESASPPERPYALYVGGISPNKNLATLIRAFARLKPSQSNLSLILVGDYASDGFKTCYRDLLELRNSLGLDREVTFAGFVPDEELCRLYNGASVFVMPSYDEGFGLPALEAMACGAPVIVSTGNALEEVVGPAGLVVAADDEAGLARAIDRVAGDAQLTADMRDNSLCRAAQFSWERAAAELVDIFEETATASRRR